MLCTQAELYNFTTMAKYETNDSLNSETNCYRENDSSIE